MKSRAAVMASAATSAALALLATLSGCDRHSEWPEPAEQLPGWIYDAPYYYEPARQGELMALDPGPEGQTPHYYSRRRTLLIKRPDLSDAHVTPRLAVCWTSDRGLTWHKAGHFGLEQNYFALPAPGDGDFGVRFAGRGFAPSRAIDLIPPHRVYHVDTVPPQVIVQVTPFKLVYRPGEAITVSWTVRDAHIDPAQKVTLYDIGYPSVIRVIGAEFPLNGSVGVRIPPAAEQGGVRFAIEATDKAGNISRGYSFLVRTSQYPPPATQPDLERRRRVYREPAPTPPPMEPDIPAPPAQPQQPAPPVPPDSGARPPAPPVTPPDQVVRPPLGSAAPPRARAGPTDAELVDQTIEPSYRPKLYPTTNPER